MADALWEREFRGKHLSLSLEDLTVRRMRQIKNWFGDEYGIPSRFITLLLMGEVDALTAALYLHGEKVNDPIGSPLDYEFNLSEFAEVKPKPKRASGKAGGGEDQTLTPETQTN